MEGMCRSVGRCRNYFQFYFAKNVDGRLAENHSCKPLRDSGEKNHQFSQTSWFYKLLGGNQNIYIALSCVYCQGIPSRTYKMRFSPHLCVGFLFDGCALPSVLPPPPPPPALLLPRVSHAHCSHTTYSHTTLSHTTYSHTTLSHTTLSHNSLTHNFSHTQLAHTQLSHTQLNLLWRHRPSLCVAGVGLGDADLHFVWQARTWRHRRALHGRRRLWHWAGSGGPVGSR